MNCWAVGDTVNIHSQSSNRAAVDIRGTSGPDFPLFLTSFTVVQQLKPLNHRGRFMFSFWELYPDGTATSINFYLGSTQENERKWQQDVK